MPEPRVLILFGTASLAMLVIPGPSVLYIVTRSISQGRRAGLVSMLGIQAGGLVHVAAAALGLSALVATSATAFTILKYAGAAYLVFLGVRKLKEKDEPLELPANRSGARLFWEGALVNALNPKTAIFFLAFLPQFVHPEHGPISLQIAVLGALFLGLAVISDGAYALVAGTAGGWLRRRDSGGRLPARISGGIYIGLGVSAALSDVRPSTS